MPTLLVVTLASTMAGVVGAPAAQAADEYVPNTTLTRAHWGHLDANTPTRSYFDPAGDVPIGSWLDDRGPHLTRSYATFDLTQFAGRRIIAASLTGKETHAADCAKRSVEVWSTTPFTAQSSFLRPPREKERLATAGAPTGGCLVDNASFDMAEAVRKAVRAGEKTLTVSLRVPGLNELDPKLHRRWANDFKLQVTHNTPPPKPVNPFIQYFDRPCATSAPGTYLPMSYQRVGATFPRDPDGKEDEVRATFTLWPADEPTKRETRWSIVPWWGEQVDFAMEHNTTELVHGKTYAFTFHADDGTDTSAPTETCYFTMDRVAPAKPPVVTSPEYSPGEPPSGDVGLTGHFTLDAGGDPDVVAFRWGTNGLDHDVRPDKPGGKATVEFTPVNSGWGGLYAQSVDRAGNTSESGRYSFVVRESRPWVTSQTYPGYTPGGGIGVPGEFVFEPRVPATEYRYRYNGGPEQTAPVRPDGTGAVTLTPQRGGKHKLEVRAKEPNGNLAATRVYEFPVKTAPEVKAGPGEHIVGAETTLTFTPGMPGVTEYEYWFEGGPHRKVAAGPDGSATVRWVPTQQELTEVRVFSTAASGEVSDEGWLSTRWVNSGTPVITRTGGTRPGDPAVVTAVSAMPNPTEYVWQVANGEWQTLPANPDGSGTFTWTPPDDGNYPIGVYARNATGAESGADWHHVDIYSYPHVNSTVYPAWQWGGGVGVPGEFTFRTRENFPNVVEFVYILEARGETRPPQTVAARPDGTATVTITPTRDGLNRVLVRAKNADGTLSGQHQYSMYVNHASKR